MTLDEFTIYISGDIKNFKHAYLAKHEANPEHYPLSIAEDDEGLWLEFFLTYLQTGEV